MIFTEPVTMLRPISFARRDDDSLICAWHLQFIESKDCTGYLPLPSADGRTISMGIEPSCLLRIGSCAPRRTSTGKVFRYRNPIRPSISMAGVFNLIGAVKVEGDVSGDISFAIQLSLSGVPGHGHCLARRILSPRQLDYPVKRENVEEHSWVNLVQDADCPGQGWRLSQFPAGLLFEHTGSVVLGDHNLWFREGPLEYPDCLFDE